MRNFIKSNLTEISSNSRILRYAFYASLASTLFVLEAFIPKPVPFIKLGLANIVILIVLYSNDIKGAFIVSIAKSLIGTFVTGTIFSPTIILSLGSSIFATTMMSIFLSKHFNFSILGISVIGAVSHNIAQIFFVRLLFIKSNAVFQLTPLLILLGICSGLFTGYISYYLFKKVDKIVNKRQVNQEQQVCS